MELTEQQIARIYPRYRALVGHSLIYFPGGQLIDRDVAARVAALIAVKGYDRVVEIAPCGGVIAQMLLSVSPNVKVELISPYLSNPAEALLDSAFIDPGFLTSGRAFHLAAQGANVLELPVARCYVLSGYLRNIDFRINSFLAAMVGRLIIWHSVDDYKLRILNDLEDNLCRRRIQRLEGYDIYILESDEVSTMGQGTIDNPAVIG